MCRRGHGTVISSNPDSLVTLCAISLWTQKPSAWQGGPVPTLKCQAFFSNRPTGSLGTAQVLGIVDSFPAPSLDCAYQLAIKVLGFWAW